MHNTDFCQSKHTKTHTNSTMTLPRRAPCSSKQARAFANDEVRHLQEALAKKQQQQESDNERRRKTPLSLRALSKQKTSGGKRLNEHASSVLFGWLEQHMEHP